MHFFGMAVDEMLCVRRCQDQQRRPMNDLHSPAAPAADATEAPSLARCILWHTTHRHTHTQDAAKEMNQHLIMRKYCCMKFCMHV